MSYIKHEPVTVTKLTCNHPKVKRIWEYGGASTNPTDGTMHSYVSIQLDNDEVVNFKGDENESPELKAEKYLTELV